MTEVVTGDMSTSEPPVDLAAGLNVAQLAQVYARVGRIHIPAVLNAECATAAYHSLAEQVPWQLHLNDGERVFDLEPTQVQSLPPASQVLLHDRVNANAVAAFQFLFDNFPLSDAYVNGEYRELYAMRIYEFLNSPRFLDFARCLTGEQRIAMADAQATLYRPGHFLTRHDDAIQGPRRLAAYVLNLTPRWRADWGGILMFLDSDGHLAEGYTPAFNALNVFKVPQAHAVSYVAPMAACGRYSISGWLRES